MDNDMPNTRRAFIASTAGLAVTNAGCLSAFTGSEDEDESYMNLTSQLNGETDVDVTIYNVTDDERMADETVTVTPEEIHKVNFQTNPSGDDSYPDIRGTARLTDAPSISVSKTTAFPTGSEKIFWAKIPDEGDITMSIAEI